jgi:membrane-bound serine protease (ClpP class)
MDVRFWAFLFTLLMVVAIFLEMLTPTMGGFTVVALGFGAASIWMGFRASTSFGYIISALDLALFPITLYFGITFLKRSPLMHQKEMGSSVQNSPDALPLTELLGKQGRALTPLRPGGAALIGSRRLDVVTEGKFVASDTEVKVIQVEGSKIVVEPLEGQNTGGENVKREDVKRESV